MACFLAVRPQFQYSFETITPDTPSVNPNGGKRLMISDNPEDIDFGTLPDRGVFMA